MPPSSRNITESAKHQALEWQIVLWSGDVTQDEQSLFNAWLHEQSENQQAWDWLQEVNQPFNQVSEKMASNVLRQDSPSFTRRKMLFSIGLISSLTAMGYGAHKTEHWHIAVADISTKKGERQTKTLPDGTQITLNTDTAIDINFTDNQRALRLYHGEIMVVTAKDSFAVPRPFMIETRAGTIRPIGTRFSVRQLDDKQHQTQVSVFEGLVEIQSISGDVQQLKASEQISFSQHTVNQLMPVNIQTGAWTQGKLIVERQRLGDFVQELSRYRQGVLRCDPNVADIIVSGVYLLDDTDAILQSLLQGLPIQMKAFTRYWITLSAAS